jgi:RNA polymerase sigma-70 factor (ECF subfamily)
MYYQLQKDEVLLSLLTKSDAKEAFDEIYRRYWLVVFRYAIGKVHVKEIAEDLCQDVFVSLWQRRNAVTIQNLEAYLIQATKYGVLNHYRSTMKVKKQDLLAVTNQLSNHDTENKIALHDLQDAWNHEIGKLPAKTQYIFRLSKMDNLSNLEIANCLELSEKAVEYHITKSYKILRLQLKDFILLLLVYISTF